MRVLLDEERALEETLGATKAEAEAHALAWDAFYDQSAMRGLATGNRPGKPAERKQEILTPQVIVDVCAKLWGRIELDPCYCDGALTNPLYSFTYPAVDALKVEWGYKAFINPPYKDLKAWLAHGREQKFEQIWLVPVRTHRKWFRAWRDSLGAYVEMDPIAFVGYDQVFPAPLMLGYKGKKATDFLAAASHLGSGYSPDNDVPYISPERSRELMASISGLNSVARGY